MAKRTGYGSLLQETSLDPESPLRGKKLVVLSGFVCGASSNACSAGMLVEACLKLADTSVVPLEEAINACARRESMSDGERVSASAARLSMSDVEPRATASLQGSLTANGSQPSNQGHRTLRLKVASRSARGKRADDPFQHVLSQSKPALREAEGDMLVVGDMALQESPPAPEKSPAVPTAGSESESTPHLQASSPGSVPVLGLLQGSSGLDGRISSCSPWKTPFSEGEEVLETQDSYNATPAVQEMVNSARLTGRMPLGTADTPAAQQSPSSGLLGMLVSMVSTSMSPKKANGSAVGAGNSVTSAPQDAHLQDGEGKQPTNCSPTAMNEPGTAGKPDQRAAQQQSAPLSPIKQASGIIQGRHDCQTLFCDACAPGAAPLKHHDSSAAAKCAVSCLETACSDMLTPLIE
jgi:hypothetical protein